MSQIQMYVDEQMELAEYIAAAHESLISETVTSARVENRIRALNNKWKSYQENHAVLWKNKYSAKPDIVQALNAHDYFTKKHHQQTEESYLSALEKMIALKEEFDAARPADASINQSTIQQPQVAIPNLKMPKFEVPTFDGDRTAWMNFKEMFLQLIAMNPNLSSVQRLFLLKSYLTGRAEKKIRNISLIGENYQHAWDCLVTYYDNKRALVNVSLTQLFHAAPATKDTVESLERLYSDIEQALASLEALKRPVAAWDDLLVYIIVRKLNKSTIQEWERFLGASTEPPKWSQLKEFLLGRIRSFTSYEGDCLNEAAGVSSPISSVVASGNQSKAKQSSFGSNSHHVNSRGTISTCSLCRGEHYIAWCPQYQAMSAATRAEKIKELNLCFNCLGSTHLVSKCSSRKACQDCGLRHHTSIHFPGSLGGVTSQETSTTPSASVPAQSQNFVQNSIPRDPTSHAATHGQLAGTSSAILATAIIKVRSKTGELIEGRALIDPCSQVTLTSENFAQQLKLQRHRYNHVVSGVGGGSSFAAKGLIFVELFSRWEHRICVAETIVLTHLTDYVPRAENYPKWSVLDGLELADPEYSSSRSIDIILGVDVYQQIIQPGLRRESLEQPIAQQTSLGWIISGRVLVGEQVQNPVSSFHISTDQELSDLIKKFWIQQEVFADIDEELSSEDDQCEDYYKSTVSRNESGRYIVRLPFKSSPNQLGDSRGLALKMLDRGRARFNRDGELYEKYKQFLEEYEKLGHMSRVDPKERDSPGVYYLPHHPVVRESSLTTKLRVVFNGSAKTSSKLSLNDLLHEGPKLQAEIFNVISRWRKFKYVYSGDVTKMFRQILIHPEDRDYQRILWREVSGELIEYQLNTVTYGTRSAPYLAIRTLHQLAEDEGDKYPEAKEVVLHTTYMDDVYGGSSSIEGCKKQIIAVTEMFASAGLPLQKWTSNHPEILRDIGNSPEDPSIHLIDNQECHRTLGLNWDSTNDHFFYFPNVQCCTKILTKRVILSQVAQLYDPLGWIAPFIVKGKLLIRELWKMKLGWDEQLSPEFVQRWSQFCKEVQGLEIIKVPRHFNIVDSTKRVELHGFADASGVAYGTVIYLKVFNVQEAVSITLVSSKSKLAPINDEKRGKRSNSIKVTIPRLELMAASLMARHVVSVCKALDIKNITIHLWTDSSVVLHWIHAEAAQYKQFVRNRLEEIQRLVPQANWRHISGEDNPADLVSRGVSSKKLANHQPWWTGPPWLAESEPHWPIQKFLFDESEDLEMKKVAVHAVSEDKTYQAWDLIEKYDSLKKLLAITAWCRRVFLVKREKIWRKTTSGGTSEFVNLVLQPKEIEEARIFWTKETQAEYFTDEIKSLRTHKCVPRRSPLYRLVPFIDNQGVIRLTGRIQKLSLEEDFKHPAILPSDSKFNELILQQIHRQTFHGGVQLMLSTLRRKYWIIGGRKPIKCHIYRCVTCARHRGEVAKQLMGQLPLRRITPARPFLHCGVDYAGPLTLLRWRGRGAKTYKGFLAIFVCFTTSAVHIELVTDYSTEGFLACFKRFTARRGICATISSDCGTNFVGADKELRSLFDSTKRETQKIAHSIAKDGTKWIFNPPGAPHHGGKWEAAVKSAKFHLKRVIGDSKLTYEELTTLLTQTEAILNSRPLCELPDDHNEFAVLTPGHFLIGSAITTVPEPSLSHLPVSRLSRYQHIRQMTEKFWELWSTDYIQKLQEINKWHKPMSNIQLGSLVLITDERLPPTKWAMGKVTKLHLGDDGLCRVVTVKSQDSTFTRPIVKICPLPVEVLPAEHKIDDQQKNKI